MGRIVRRSVAIAIVLSLHWAVASAQSTVPANTGSRVIPSDAQSALDFQNAKRHDVGSPPLQWSPQLAGVAQNWANHLASAENCDLVHTTGGHYGENLFAGSGRAYTAVDAAKDWYGEIAKFHYGPLTDNNWADAGHYTQMVWRNTTSVGMGRATCPGGWVVIVAEYDPPGNYIGQKPY